MIEDAYANMLYNNKKIFKNTQLEYNERISELYKCNVYLKREDQQYIRSFKCRGAFNAIIKSKDVTKIIICASAGNHAQGVAYVCEKLGRKCEIYVPETTPLQKINRIKKLGKSSVKLVITGSNFDECLNTAKLNSEGKIFIHPFDNKDVIHGQGTVALEICNTINPDYIVCSIGGGGLISGCLKYKQEKNLNYKVIGVEPENADSMHQSLLKKERIILDIIDTFVDGACVKQVGELTYEICKNNLEIDDIKVVSKGQICNEMINLYQEDGIVVEPAGVLPLAALDKIENIENKTIVCILSGGNNDILRYQEIMEHNLVYLGVRHYFLVEFTQKPSELKNYIINVLQDYADIIRFEYVKKNNKSVGSVLIGMDVIEDISHITNNMIQKGYKFKKIDNNDMIYNILI